MIVININGTATRRCNCGSWIQHWHNFTGRTATMCKAEGCSRRDVVGAHVRKNGVRDQSHYIVPLCNLHNRQTSGVKINKGTVLVPANKSFTCS